MKKVTVHYVDNKRFYEAILAYREKCRAAKLAGKDEPRMPEYIGECIYKIANRLSYNSNFINYSFKDEMISDGIENCIMYFKDFDPDKYKNPFAYFTQIIWYAFIRRINKEEKNRYIIYKNFETSMIQGGQTHLLVDEDNNLPASQLYDNIKDFMQRYEAKEETKKVKRQAAKALQKVQKEEDDANEAA